MTNRAAVWLLLYGLLQSMLGAYIAWRAWAALHTSNAVLFQPLFRLSIRLIMVPWYGRECAERRAAERTRGWCYSWLFAGCAIFVGGCVFIVPCTLEILGR